MFTKGSKSYWPIIFILSCALFLFSVSIRALTLHLGFWDIFQIPTSHSVVTSSFDSKAVNIKFRDQFQLTNLIGKSNENTDIRFNFMYYQLNELEDLFQTDSANSGIRVESNKQGDLAIIVGANNSTGYVSSLITHVYFPLFYKIAPQSLHKLRIHAWNHHAVIVWLDGVRVATLVDPAINYHVADIKIGKGFSDDRVFDGRIKNFKVDHTWSNKFYDHLIEISLVILSILAFFLGVFSFIKCLPSVLSRNEKIAWLSFLVLIGFIAMLSYNFISSIYLSMGYPYSSFLSLPSSVFSDYYLLPVLDESLSPYIGSTVNLAIYFPFAYLFTYPSVLLPHAYLLLMNISFVITICVFVWHYFSSPSESSIEKINNYKNVFILAFLTYPFLYAFERGNTEVILFMFTAIAIYLYEKKFFYSSAFIIAAASAMKIFPILFLALFVADKKYKPAFISMFIFLALTLISLTIFKGGFENNLYWLISAMHHADVTFGFNSMPSISSGVGEWPSVDILSLIKLVYHYVGRNSNLDNKFVSGYHFFVLFAAFLICCYVIFIEKIFWKRLMLLVSIMLLFPILSFQYKLMHIYLPLAFFVNEERISSEKMDNYYLILFILLLVPSNYCYLQDRIMPLSSILDVVILLLFTTIILSKGIIASIINYKMEKK